MIEIHQIPQNLLTIDETDETHISKLDNSSLALFFADPFAPIWAPVQVVPLGFAKAPPGAPDMSEMYKAPYQTIDS
jgi:hypothetical protein